MSTPAERYAASAPRRREAGPALERVPRAVRLRARRLPGRGLPRRWRAARACWSPRRPAPARPSSASSPCTWRSRPGRKCFYTTPIKALSNQKYARPRRALRRRPGRPAHRRQRGQRRGAGRRDDHRGAAQHALRRLAARCAGLGYVVMDEVHYLADRFRGAVWEEVIIHLPESVPLVVAVGDRVATPRSSATGSTTVRGDTEVDRRGAPARCRSGSTCMVGQPAVRPVRRATRRRRSGAGQPRAAAGSPATSERRLGPRRPRRRRGRRRAARPAAAGRGRARGLDRRAAPTSSTGSTREGLLPAITFIFSRAGCDAAVQQCLRAGAAADHARGARRDPRASSRSACADLPDEDLARARLPRVARRARAAASPPTTPGMLPTFKEVVEELFAARPGQGRVRHRDAGARHQHAGPHAWCSRSWSSGTARRTPTSRRGSTPS